MKVLEETPMPNDYEALARALMNAKQGPKLARGLERLNTALKTEEGRQLLQLLSQGGGADKIKVAAEAMLRGDNNAAMNAVSSLLSTKEGAALIPRLMEILGN